MNTNQSIKVKHLCDGIFLIQDVDETKEEYKTYDELADDADRIMQALLDYEHEVGKMVGNTTKDA